MSGTVCALRAGQAVTAGTALPPGSSQITPVGAWDKPRLQRLLPREKLRQWQKSPPSVLALLSCWGLQAFLTLPWGKTV